MGRFMSNQDKVLTWVSYQLLQLKATRSLKSQAKKRKTKGNQNAALPVEKVEAKKTDAHGAEDGKPSEKKDQDRDDEVILVSPAKYSATKSMDPLFEGENIPDTPHPIWGNQTVKYLDDSELEAYEITVENGKIVHAGGDNAGKLFDTSEAASHASGEGSAIFVMTPDGKIYASHYHEAGAFHHSSLSQGKDIAAGGELVVENGMLKEISNQSGHYEPSQAMNDQLMEELKERGLNTDDSNYIL